MFFDVSRILCRRFYGRVNSCCALLVGAALLATPPAQAQETPPPPQIQYLEGHTAPVYAVGNAPDGKTIVSASVDGSVRVWDRATGKLIRTIAAHRGPILTLDVARDGRTFATGGLDRTLRIFDLPSQHPLLSLGGIPGNNGLAATSADGAWVITGDDANFVRLWNGVTGAHVRDFGGSTTPITGLALLPNAEFIVALNKDGTIRGWKVADAAIAGTVFSSPANALAASLDGARIATAGEDGFLRLLNWPPVAPLNLAGHSDVVSAMALARDGKLLLTGGADQVVQLFSSETADGKAIRSLAGQSGKVLAVALSEDAQIAATASETGLIHFWETKEGADRLSLAGHVGAIRSLEFRPKTSQVVSAGADGTVRLWNLPKTPRLLSGHEAAVVALFRSADGKTLVTTGSDKSVRLFNVEDGKPLHAIKGFPQAIVRAALSADGKQVAVGDVNGDIRLQAESAEKPAETALGAHAGGVTGLLYHPQTKQLISSGNDGLVKFWNLPALPGSQLPVHTAAAQHAVISRDGQIVISAGADKVIRVSNAADGKELRLLEGLDAVPSALALRGDGKLAAAADANGRVMFWEVTTGKILGELSGHAGSVHGLSFHPTEPVIATSGADGTVRSWNIPQPFVALAGHAKPARTIAVSKDGAVIATAGEDGTARVWSRKDGKQLHEFSDGATTIGAVALSQNGELLAAGSGAGNVLVRGALDGMDLGSLGAHDGAVTSLAIDPTQKLVASAGADGTVKLWPLPVPSPQKMSGHSASVTGLVISADGKLAASAGKDKAIHLYELPAAKPLGTVEGLPGELTSIAISPDKVNAIAGTAAGQIAIVPVAGGADVQTLNGHAGAVNAVAFHPKENKIASAGADGTLHVWELPKPAQQLAGHGKGITAIVLSPDGKTIATASSDNSIRLWDAEKGTPIKALAGHLEAVTSLAWKADNTQLVSGSADKSARLWNIADGKTLAEFPMHAAAVNAVAITPDGKTVATGAADNQIRLWNVDETIKAALEKPAAEATPEAAAEEKRFRILDGHKQPVSGLTMTANGQTLFSAAHDGTLRTWNIADGKPGWTADVKSPVASFALSRDEKLLVAAAQKTVQTFQAADGKPVAALQTDGPNIGAVAFSTDNLRIAAAAANGQLLVWETTGRPVEQLSIGKSAAPAISFGADARTVFAASEAPVVLRQTLSTTAIIPIAPEALQAVAFTPDGTAVLTGGVDKSVRLFTLADGKQVRDFKGLTGVVNSLSVSGNGQFVAAASADKTARIWQLADAKDIVTLTHPEAVNTILLNADGARAITGAADQLVRVWDLPSGKPLIRYTLHEKPVRSVALTADAKLLLSGGDDGQVFSIPLNLPQLIPAHDPGAVTVAFTHDGKNILSGGADKKLKQFDLAGKLVREFPGIAGAVRDVALRHDGAQIAAVCDDKQLYLFRGDNAQQEKKIPLTGDVASVAYSPLSTRLVLGAVDKSLQIVDPAAGQILERIAMPAAVYSAAFLGDEATVAASGDAASTRIQPLSIVRIFSGHQGAVFSVAWTADGKSLLSGGADKTIKHWNADNGQPIRSIPGHEGNVVDVVATADGQKIVSASNDKTIRVWTLANGAPALSFPVPTPVRNLAVSADGLRAAAATDEAILRVFDLLNGKELERFAGHAAAIGSAEFAADGKTLVSASDDKSVRLWHVSAAAVIPADAAKIHDLDILPDGSHLLTAGEDRIVKLWDMTGKLVRQFGGLPAPVRCLAVRPDGLQIAAGGDPLSTQTNVIVWKVADAAAVQTITTPVAVTALAYSADDRVAIAGADKKLRVFNGALPLRLLEEITVPAVLSDLAFVQDGRTMAASAGDNQSYLFDDSLEQMFLGHEGAVVDAEFIAAGARLVTSGADKTVRLWNVADGKELAKFSGQADVVNVLSITADGTRLIGGGNDKMLRLWPLDAATAEKPPANIPSTVQIEQPSPIVSLSSTGDGRRLAFACNGDALIRVWDLPLQKELERLTGHTSVTTALAVSPDGKTIYSGNVDRAVRRWQPSVMAAIRAHEGPIRDVVMSPDGAAVISTGADKKLIAWNTQTLQQKLEFAGVKSPLKSLALSGDGKKLAGLGDSPEVQVWDPADGKLLLSAALPSPGHDVVLGAAGDKLIVAGSDNIVRNYGTTLADGQLALELIHESHAHTAPVKGVALAADNRSLFSVSDDKSAKRWYAADFGPRLEINHHEGAIYDVEHSPDGKLLATACADRTVRVFHAATGELAFRCEGHERQVNSVTFHPGNKELASAGLDGTVRIWNAVPPPEPPKPDPNAPAEAKPAEQTAKPAEGEPKPEVPPPPELGQQIGLIKSDTPAAFYTVSYSPDGNGLFTAGAPAAWQHWKRSDFTLIRKGIGHNQTIYSFAWNKAYSRFATLDYSGNLFIWNPSDGAVIYHQQLPAAAGYSLSYNPDGTEIIAGTQDPRVLRVIVPPYAR